MNALLIAKVGEEKTLAALRTFSCALEARDISQLGPEVLQPVVHHLQRRRRHVTCRSQSCRGAVALRLLCFRPRQRRCSDPLISATQGFKIVWHTSVAASAGGAAMNMGSAACSASSGFLRYSISADAPSASLRTMTCTLCILHPMLPEIQCRNT